MVFYYCYRSKIKNINNCTNAEIEAPIKIYITGAAFRKRK